MKIAEIGSGTMTNFEFCNNKRKINKILKEYEDGKELLDYEDDTELCFYQEDNFSMYLAVYDDHLEWTFSEHFDEDNDFDNVGSVLYAPHKPNMTHQDLQELCEILLPIAKEWYDENGGYDKIEDMPFIDLEEILLDKAKELYTKNNPKEKDIYGASYDYDDICIVVAIMDFIQQYDTELDTQIPDTEDVIELANKIKQEWKKEFETLSHEQQGYIGAYAHNYLRDMYL